MELDKQILSDITVFGKYAKYLPAQKTREDWSAICNRYEDMLIEKYPELAIQINSNMELVRQKKILPSMRAMQFAGPAIKKNNSRLFNCSYLPIDHYKSFSETMFLLLGGTGVGYSIQNHHIEQLPEIRKPFKEKRYLVGDSLEGWADTIKMLMRSYLGETSYKYKFDFSDIRPKGALLITAGGKAPGPEPLMLCVAKITEILENKEDGEKLNSVECHDILCHIANAVLAGGIRRAAMIALFDFNDKLMMECKFGDWWVDNEQRGRANNSAVILRHKIKQRDFLKMWKQIQKSGCGEPGIYLSNDKDWGINPCAEISLRPYQFCNLCEVNVSDVTTQEDLNIRVAAATFFGTLQAGFTDFHYLRSIWKKTTEKDALVGVGMTGIASGTVLDLDLKFAAKVAVSVNETLAKTIGIRPAARITTIKPSGTTSCVLGTSSGIHAWHSEFYLRRSRLGRDEALAQYLLINHPELVEDDQMNPAQVIVTLPQRAPEGAITRGEDVMDVLERVKRFNVEWVKGGHIRGQNANNVSATINIKDGDWKKVGDWIWKNRNYYNGLSVLPFDNGSYVQAPFEDIDEDTFNELMARTKGLDLSKVVEIEDNVDFGQTAACSGGSCEVV